MNRSILVTALTVAALSTPSTFAQATTPAPAKPAMSMDMEKQMPRMQENMKDMQLQMEKIKATTDPAERQKLMQAHMQAMQDNMKTMHAMGGPMMSGGGKSGGMAMGGTKDAAAGHMMQHHAMMEKRVDMMQMMMEQMVQHQMMESTPGK